MDKQKKQLIALGVLVLVAGIVAAFNFGLFGGDDDEGTTTTADTPEPAAPASPQGESGQTPAAGGNGADAEADEDEDAEEDLPIPAPVVPPRRELTWAWERNLQDPPYDPLYVQNMDVVEPERKRYIEELQEQWVLEGFTVTKQNARVLDRDGQHVMGERVMEPRPLTRKVVKRDDDGEIVYDRNGRVVLEDEIVYEQKVDDNGNPVTDDDGNPVYETMPKTDPWGEVITDADGNPVMVPKPKYVQQKDEDGEPLVDDDGNPVWEMRPKRHPDGSLVIKKVPAFEDVPVVDENGQVQLDERGNLVTEKEPVYVQKVDENGAPMFENGEPVYETDPETGEPLPVMVPDDTPQYEVRPVKVAWFKGRARPYREGDRLTNTLFTIKRIFTSRLIVGSDGSMKVRSGVDLVGDTGAEITLYLGDDERYGDTKQN